MYIQGISQVDRRPQGGGNTYPKKKQKV